MDCQPSSSSTRVLVVEDDALMSRVISRTLVRLGCEIIAAPSCAAARALACRFDIGVFDIGLCDGSGIELARKLLDTQQVEFAVFFTGELSAGVLCQARHLGPVVKKSEGPEALAPIVAGTLHQARGRQSGIVCRETPATQPGAEGVA